MVGETFSTLVKILGLYGAGNAYPAAAVRGTPIVYDKRILCNIRLFARRIACNGRKVDGTFYRRSVSKLKRLLRKCLVKNTPI